MKKNPGLIAVAGVAFLGFRNLRAGRWVGDERAIWITRDGGLHWPRHAFP